MGWPVVSRERQERCHGSKPVAQRLASFTRNQFSAFHSWASQMFSNTRPRLCDVADRRPRPTKGTIPQLTLLSIQFRRMAILPHSATAGVAKPTVIAAPMRAVVWERASRPPPSPPQSGSVAKPNRWEGAFSGFHPRQRGRGGYVTHGPPLPFVPPPGRANDRQASPNHGPRCLHLRPETRPFSRQS